MGSEEDVRARVPATSEAVVVDTQDGIDHYRWAALIARLRMEVRSGLLYNVPRPTLEIYRTQFGGTHRTRQAALSDMEKRYEEKFGRKYGGR